VDFAREADSFDDALTTAIEAVYKAGATVDRVEPDPLVSLAEISARTGLTRGAMTHYSKGARGKNFPAPVARVTSESPLWDWATVARWLFKNKKLKNKKAAKEMALEAEIVKEANEAIRRGQVHIGDELKKKAEEYSAELCAAVKAFTACGAILAISQNSRQSAAPRLW
jgi:hypothetical protein